MILSHVSSPNTIAVFGEDISTFISPWPLASDACTRDNKGFNSHDVETPQDDIRSTKYIGLVRLADEGFYTGELEGMKFHGTGKLVYNSGARYEGEFRDGQKGPFGMYIHEDGSTYVGEFHKDLKCGRGMYIANGYTLLGTWENDVLHGKALLKTTEDEKNERSGKVINFIHGVLQNT